MISNIGSNQGIQPGSLSRAERSEKLDKALDNFQVKLAELSPGQLAANREYGHQMVSDIGSARFAQPAPGQSPEDFQILASRLGGA